jgi:hypothetical protein
MSDGRLAHRRPVRQQQRSRHTCVDVAHTSRHAADDTGPNPSRICHFGSRWSATVRRPERQRLPVFSVPVTINGPPSVSNVTCRTGQSPSLTTALWDGKVLTVRVRSTSFQIDNRGRTSSVSRNVTEYRFSIDAGNCRVVGCSHQSSLTWAAAENSQHRENPTASELASRFRCRIERGRA